jgi:hypothetical protein
MSVWKFAVKQEKTLFILWYVFVSRKVSEEKNENRQDSKFK